MATGNHLTIKAWAEEDRPREKLLLKGKHLLTDAELLAILVGSGTAGQSAVDVCRRLLDRLDGDLNRLARMSVEEITGLKIKGIGTARAVALVAALELARRRPPVQPGSSSTITSSKDIYALLAPKLADLAHEEFHVIFLNRANRVLAVEVISTGGISGTVADPRRIFKRALDHKASYIIACHNHPSGNLKPSPADLKLTRNLADSGKLLEIQLLDHVIITDGQYYSFADDGKL